MAIHSSGENGNRNASNGISDFVFGDASNDTPLWKYGMLKSIAKARALMTRDKKIDTLTCFQTRCFFVYWVQYSLCGKKCKREKMRKKEKDLHKKIRIKKKKKKQSKTNKNQKQIMTAKSRTKISQCFDSTKLDATQKAVGWWSKENTLKIQCH